MRAALTLYADAVRVGAACVGGATHYAAAAYAPHRDGDGAPPRSAAVDAAPTLAVLAALDGAASTLGAPSGLDGTAWTLYQGGGDGSTRRYAIQIQARPPDVV